MSKQWIGSTIGAAGSVALLLSFVAGDNFIAWLAGLGIGAIWVGLRLLTEREESD